VRRAPVSSADIFHLGARVHKKSLQKRHSDIFAETQILRGTTLLCGQKPHTLRALSCPPHSRRAPTSAPTQWNRKNTFIHLQAAAPRWVHVPLPAASHPTAALCFPASRYCSSSPHL